MSADMVIDIARQALWTIVEASAPMLITSLVVGLIISIFQTVTSIQEQTLTFVPKLLAVFLVIIITGSWMLKVMTDFAVELFSNFNMYIK
ncbi:flagellar biosynthesis protein FliQ [Anaeromicropila herbilytica]|uniref:Flagellar biosynthetic protein FliQ n=1 Tax=Anaeromicropila herbilytica TaxID=2785025 RepID=A0A7R7IDX2_9FIRM|nr:flagellar biosynthesis protein FliQ [Anaeromicropila herbilytica]BCN31519.1 flagellar biosynthetic protein FliQ [Anaeromicropila herbilytica]